MTASGDSLAVQTAPRAIGRYQLLEPLGRGGMGTVYRARQVQLEKLVAVKVLDPLIASGQAGVTRFLREARAAAKIRHPNVVEVFDVGFDEGAAFLAMELLEGQDLAALLRTRQRLPLHEIVEILAPVLAGVRAAHEAGVVHRDLKPSNIFLARRGRTRQEPVVLDFGVSRVLLDDENGLTPVTSSETMIGTAAYIAPEQARQARLADNRSDQYSLGVILYECATGSRPFEGQSTYEILHSIATATVCPPSERNPTLPTAFDELVLRTLARDPTQRFDDLDAFARALMAFAAPRTWMAWGRELVASDLAEGDDSSTRPPSQPFAAVKPLSLPVTPAPAVAPRWRWLTLAFALGLLVSAIAAAVVRRDLPVQPKSAQPLSTHSQAAVVASVIAPLVSESASSPAAPVAPLVEKAAASEPESAAHGVTLRTPHVAASARAAAPAASASSHVEMGQNDAPILK
jgi:eukaryotic-like serine/threonine-protein kinase